MLSEETPQKPKEGPSVPSDSSDPLAKESPAAVEYRPHKRRRGNLLRNTHETLSAPDLDNVLDESITSQPSTELVVLNLIANYKFCLKELFRKLTKRGMYVSFDSVTYVTIAPIFGLDPDQSLRDAPTFKLQRARIPTPLFKDIIGDLHIALNQYGPQKDHRNMEATSRFIAPLMDRIVAQFNLLIVNSPENPVPGYIAREGWIEHQSKVFGAIAILFILVDLKTNSKTERLNTIAQVIVEADICDFMNSKVNFTSPVQIILYDGTSFEFFTFDGTTRPPRFSRGTIHHADLPTVYRLAIPDFEESLPAEFINTLRPICEIMHSIFVRGYIAGLKAFHCRRLLHRVGGGESQENTIVLLDAELLAEESLRKYLKAAQVADTGQIVIANELTAEASKELKESLAVVPLPYRRDYDLLGGWNNALCR